MTRERENSFTLLRSTTTLRKKQTDLHHRCHCCIKSEKQILFEIVLNFLFRELFFLEKDFLLAKKFQ